MMDIDLMTRIGNARVSELRDAAEAARRIKLAKEGEPNRQPPAWRRAVGHGLIHAGLRVASQAHASHN